jgi:putative transposase
MEQRVRFVTAAERRHERGVSFSDLCASYGISRKTGYKWLGRWASDGASGLEERSRVAHRRPHALSADVRERLIQLKCRRPTWGAKKLRQRLCRLFPEERWPAISTIHEFLRREGLVRRKPRQRIYTAKTRPGTEAAQPNEVWAADYKGWVLLGDRSRCDPFTLTDLYSRKALAVRGHDGSSARRVWQVLQRAFRAYGLPRVLRTDGGPPFGAHGGLSQLTVKLTKLGVQHEFSRPGKPTDNGCHERFHRTLSEDTMVPPARTMSGQQRRFDRFRRDFNEVRPHDALGGRVPDDLWTPSDRSYSPATASFEYEGWFQVRRVKTSGHTRFAGGHVHLSSSLKHELVGFEQIGDGAHRVWFGPLLLGVFNEGDRRLLRGDLNASFRRYERRV